MRWSQECNHRWERTSDQNFWMVPFVGLLWKRLLMNFDKRVACEIFWNLCCHFMDFFVELCFWLLMNFCFRSENYGNVQFVSGLSQSLVKSSDCPQAASNVSFQNGSKPATPSRIVALLYLKRCFEKNIFCFFFLKLSLHNYTYRTKNKFQIFTFLLNY